MSGGGGVRDHHHYQPQPHHQQPQPPQRNLIDSPEAYEALDLVLSQVISVRVPKYIYGSCSFDNKLTLHNMNLSFVIAISPK